MHVELTRSSVHPGLHDAHFSAPFTGHCAPLCATPLLHVHVFSTTCKQRRCQEKVNLTLDCSLGCLKVTMHFPFCECMHMCSMYESELSDMLLSILFVRMCKRTIAFCRSLIFHPVLHDTHFAAPLRGQSTPVGGTPSSHVQTFAAK